MSCRFLKYLLKPNTFLALEEYTTAPTRVYLLEILKEATNLFTKLRQRLKLPRPEASMLPEASMTKARSMLAWQTGPAGRMTGGTITGPFVKHLFFRRKICDVFRG